MGQDLSGARTAPLFAVKSGGSDSGTVNRTPNEAGVNRPPDRTAYRLDPHSQADGFRPRVDAGQVVHEVWSELYSI